MRSFVRAAWLSLAVSVLACDEGSRPDPQPPVSAALTGTSSVAASAVPSNPLTSAEPARPMTSVTPIAPPPPDAVAKLAAGNNEFGFELYERLRAEAGNNILSPMSLTTVLAMTYGGAKGETAAQMKKVLGFDGAADRVAITSGQLLQSLASPSRPLTFRVANQLFADNTFAVAQPFADQAKSAYGAPIERADFMNAPEPARLRINEWVESKTEKRIKDLIPPRAVSGAKLVLVNAIYFLGDWAQPFEKAATLPAAFQRSTTDRIDVPTMRQTAGFPYAKRDGMQAIELPYKGNDMSMLVIVPDAVDGLDATEKLLDAKRLDAWVNALKSERVELALPKFEIAPTASLALSSHLIALGMTDAFDCKKADFTGIGKGGICISEVFHKGFVKVDEKGTEAAAASAVVVGPGSAAPAKAIELKADRPFLFVIRDRKSGMVLFMGRVADPSTR